MHRTATIDITTCNTYCTPHSLESHISALRRGLEQADLVLTTGGTSMGASDLLKPVIERHLDGTVHFGRVAIKPGKPTTFATVPAPDKAREVPVFALPGNPASALVTFARGISADVVAEGIENADALRTLMTAGVRAGQGYHLARPMRFAEISSSAPLDIRRYARGSLHAA